jgi:hypothetical protein
MFADEFPSPYTITTLVHTFRLGFIQHPFPTTSITRFEITIFTTNFTAGRFIEFFGANITSGHLLKYKHNLNFKFFFNFLNLYFLETE